jgi:alpha-beta hydrolase superfamily lysophospholipase
MKSAIVGEEVFIPCGGGRLGGVWLTPSAQARAAAIIIPGSGPTDRDGNNPRGVKASTYRLLAEELSLRGVATLRVDKRGMFSSASALENPDAVTVRDYADDIAAWVREAQRISGHGPIFLIGHSEGGLVALKAAHAAPTLVAGVILAATPGRALGDVLRDQISGNPANAMLMEQAFEAIKMLERGERVSAATLHPALAPLFRESVQGFVAEIITLDPAQMLARIDAPVLVVQGGRDIQVSVHDAERLAGSRSGVDLALIEDVNHVLKEAPLDMEGNIETYTREDLTISGAVVEAIACFILRHAASTPEREETT